MKELIIILIFLLNSVFLFSLTADDPPSGKRAVISTEIGDIEILLYDETPLHRDNFIRLAKEGFYEGLLFHRVIGDFMIQTGDPLSRNASAGDVLGSSGPGYTIPAEINEKFYHKKGAIAAARKSDHVNPLRASSGSQFYIVTGRLLTVTQLNQMASLSHGPQFTEQKIKDYTTLGGAPHLDGSYTVFGEVIRGLEVVDRISKVETDTYNRPLNDVIISIRITE